MLLGIHIVPCRRLAYQQGAVKSRTFTLAFLKYYKFWSTESWSRKTAT